MAASKNWFGRGTIPAALISLFLEITAFGVILASASSIVKSPIAYFSRVITPGTGTSTIPLATLGSFLAGTMTGFLFGLVGLITGCSSLPERKASSRKGLQMGGRDRNQVQLT